MAYINRDLFMDLLFASWSEQPFEQCMALLNAPRAYQATLEDMDSNTFGRCLLAGLCSNKARPGTMLEMRMIYTYLLSDACSGQQYLDMTDDQLAMTLFQHCQDISECTMQACQDLAQAVRAAVALWQQHGQHGDGFDQA